MYLRVDNRRIHSAGYLIETNNRGYVFASIDGIPESERFFRELKKGYTLKVGIELPDNESDYGVFSLSGSYASISRARNLCYQGI